MAGVQNCIRAYRDALEPGMEIDIHPRQHLSVSVVNSVITLRECVTHADVSPCGLGVGAGGAPNDPPVAELEREGMGHGAVLFALQDAGEEPLRGLMDRPARVCRDAFSQGHTGVFSSFMHLRETHQAVAVSMRGPFRLNSAAGI